MLFISNENLTVPLISASLSPQAFRTWLFSKEPEAQAEKKIVETDISDIISTEKKRKSNKITKNLDVQKNKANSIETAKKTEENNANSQKVVEKEITVETVVVEDKKSEHAKSASIAFSSLQKTLAGMQKSISTANDNKKADVTSKKAKNEKSTTEKTKNSAKKADKKEEKASKKADKADKKSEKTSKKEEKTAKNEQKAETPKKERKSIFNWFRKK